jgi:hypothetical protein
MERDVARRKACEWLTVHAAGSACTVSHSIGLLRGASRSIASSRPAPHAAHARQQHLAEPVCVVTDGNGSNRGNR